MNYICITKNWWYNDELLCIEENIRPFGMLKTIEELFNHSR